MPTMQAVIFLFLSEKLEVLEGEMPSKQEKMVLGWAAFHQTELMENWELAARHLDLFSIDLLQ